MILENLADQITSTLTEQGNTYLSCGDDGDRRHAIFLLLEDKKPKEMISLWLEILIDPSSYPSVSVSRLEKTWYELQDIVHKKYDDWDVHKCNIGAYVVHGCISVPCHRIEYDPQYFGGNYDSEGNDYYLPVPIVLQRYKGDIEAAFEGESEYKKENIVNYSPDELYTLNGDEWDGELEQ